MVTLCCRGLLLHMDALAQESGVLAENQVDLSYFD